MAKWYRFKAQGKEDWTLALLIVGGVLIWTQRDFLFGRPEFTPSEADLPQPEPPPPGVTPP